MTNDNRLCDCDPVCSKSLFHDCTTYETFTPFGQMLHKYRENILRRSFVNSRYDMQRLLKVTVTVII